MNIMNITIRHATENDLKNIFNIEQTTSQNPWSQKQLQDALAQQGAMFFVAIENEKILGFISATIVLDELQIGEIAVKKEFQKKGIGAALIKKIFAVAKERGATFATLEVRASNDRAISLYEKIGFTKDATRAGYYQNGEDAILMSAKIL